jgi:dephospho-CoA kinase
MLIYITGVAGSGKSTLREELERKGYPAEDADDGFCAWFDNDGNPVPTLALHLRTPEWYASHRWRLLPEHVSDFADACANSVGFLLGVAANADELASYFRAVFYLTADTDLIHERLRNRDGSAHATRFAAFPSVKDWQQSAEQQWVRQGYAPLDSSGTPTEVADALIRLIAPQN